VWPPEWQHPPADAFGVRLRTEFMHPAVIEKLGQHLLDARLGQELNLKPWGPAIAREHLQLLLPLSWRAGDWTPGRPGGAVPWFDGRQVWARGSHVTSYSLAYPVFGKTCGVSPMVWGSHQRTRRFLFTAWCHPSTVWFGLNVPHVVAACNSKAGSHTPWLMPT
jgi:hypothetical protein